jgi:hypothetical protein
MAVQDGRGRMVINTPEQVPGSFGSGESGFYQAGYELPDDGMVGSAVSFEDCMPPGSSGQQVRLGVLSAAPTEDGPGQAVVVWYECLGLAATTR